MSALKFFIRHLQGERAGMGSQLIMPDRYGEQLAAASLSPTIAIQNDVLIPDVSFYQREINFLRMTAAGVAGVIIRAGQRTWPDERFQENWTKAKAAGLPRGSYWFYDSREDPKKQAALWWSLIKDDPGELVHVADLEESYGGAWFKPEHIRTFLQEFQRLSGLPDDRIAIYTGYYWWLSRVGADVFFKRFALWLAWYADMSVVRIPAPWSAEDLLFWQWTSSGDGTKYGVSSLEIDLNWYCCSLVNYRNRFNLGAQPSNGGTMPKFFRLNTTAANIRTGSGTSYPDKGDLVKGDVVQVDESPLGGWSPYKMARHADGTWVKLVDGTPLDDANQTKYWSTNAYFVEVAAFPEPLPPPVSTTPDVAYTITLGDDINYVKETITGTIKRK